MLTIEVIEEQIRVLSQKGCCKRCGSNDWGYHRTKNVMGRHCKLCRNNRARKYQEQLKKNGGSHTRKQWLDLVKTYTSCPFCNRKWEDIPARISSRKLGVVTKEHKIPVIKGGHDGIDNIIPCCYQCNSSAGGKLHGST